MNIFPFRCVYLLVVSYHGQSIVVMFLDNALSNIFHFLVHGKRGMFFYERDSFGIYFVPFDIYIPSQAYRANFIMSFVGIVHASIIVNSDELMVCMCLWLWLCAGHEWLLEWNGNNDDSNNIKCKSSPCLFHCNIFVKLLVGWLVQKRFCQILRCNSFFLLFGGYRTDAIWT